MSQLIEMFLLITRKGAEYHVYKFTASKEERERLAQSSSPEEWKKLMDEYNKKVCPIQGSESEVRAWVRSLIYKDGYKLEMWSTGFALQGAPNMVENPLNAPLPEKLYLALCKEG